MDMRAFLLLLLCSLSVSELPNNEITEERFVSAERVDVIEQDEPRAADLRTELREMSVKLAETTLMIQQLQTLNQEQGENLVKNELRINELERLNRVGQVAFSAILAQGNQFVGPLPNIITLNFQNILTNIGNAYDSSSGIFTAPVNGVYHFEIAIDVRGGYDGAVMLFRNYDVNIQLREAQSNGWGIAAKAAILDLKAGEKVRVRLASNFQVNGLSSFSGHLLFPLQ